ncbi:hypothetical protein [Desulfolutivibrio sulfoxidireducens]|uniref:hypothetical protein n=1 Tax=Desulfolutivibrio sulfoxidireducens TaxID=2773299 RepID=UPI00159EB741|nr:hypothetical protein [Desulfolutivibrio sulfoxidireducens]QLA15967.1 hypothetical protein GD605_07315 [Desulfolutivibrio sulfoxidireducens]QLA20130.1 hypothetical protein GD604_10580 [Desulfolutivibrio sulfoxidireducens]
MRIATCGAAAAIAVLAMVSFVPAALAERDVTNPLTGEVVVMKFSRTPSSRDLGKIGRKLGRKTLEDLLASRAPAQIEKLAGCLSDGKKGGTP